MHQLLLTDEERQQQALSMLADLQAYDGVDEDDVRDVIYACEVNDFEGFMEKCQDAGII